MVSGFGGGSPVGGGKTGLFELKSWSVLQDTVPDVGELKCTQVPV